MGRTKTGERYIAVAPMEYHKGDGYIDAKEKIFFLSAPPQPVIT